MRQIRNHLENLNKETAARDFRYFPAAQDQERSQCHMLPEQLFPCKNTRSSRSIPTSVHMLRPADIQVLYSTSNCK